MSEKKLFQVDIEITIDMVVAAESEAEARRIAERDYKNALEDVAYPDVCAAAVDGPLTQCPSDWTGCLPYNSDDERTVDQWFETGKEPS
jgi:hypothetical protein